MAVFEYVASVILVAGIYVIFSLGLNLEFGFAGLMNVGHVAFMAIGAYSLVILNHHGVPLILSAIIGIAISGLSGLLLTLPTEKLREDYLAFLTIGFSVLVGAFIKNEVWLTGGPAGINLNLNIGTLPIFDGLFYPVLITVIISIAVLYVILEYIIQSPWGRVLKAIREDEAVAKALGKDVFSFKVQALAIGSAIAGFAGVLWALYYTYITPTMFVPMITFYAWIIVILGGSGNNRGTIVGSLIFWTILSGTRFFGDWISISDERFSALRMVLVGVLLVFIMMYRPQGILGNKEEMILDSSQ